MNKSGFLRGFFVSIRLAVSRFFWSVLTIFSSAVGVTLFAQGGATPVPRTDANSQIAHQQLLEKARRGGIDVYFEGDSITRRWGTSDAQYSGFLENWRRNFSGWNAADFGWGADTVQNILWRVSSGELDGVHPKVIVLLAGTNNVGNAPRSGVDTAVVDEVADGIRALVSVMRAKGPEATIVLTGVTPRLTRLIGLARLDDVLLTTAVSDLDARPDQSRRLSLVRPARRPA